MSWFYRAAYRVGFTPWDQGDSIPADGDQVLDLLAEQETEEAPPYGCALDIGCGKGRYSVALAQRGWQVTGIDAVPRALDVARARAAAAHVDVEFIEGDVRHLDRLVATGYDLLLDGGCFHGMSDGDRQAVVSSESAVCQAGATLVLVAFQPHAGPGPRGITRGDLIAIYRGWTLVDDAPLAIGTKAPRVERRAQPRIYRFHRN